jgi:hypothetical protein
MARVAIAGPVIEAQGIDVQGTGRPKAVAGTIAVPMKIGHRRAGHAKGATRIAGRVTVVRRLATSLALAPDSAGQAAVGQEAAAAPTLVATVPDSSRRVDLAAQVDQADMRSTCDGWSTSSMRFCMS